jgi:hypothetical protein
MFISILFYFMFRRNDLPILPYSYLSKTPTGLPGMDRNPSRLSSKNTNELSKPLPEPKLPKPPVPLVVKVASSGQPLKKPLMT